jgi:hypothetical protein
MVSCKLLTTLAVCAIGLIPRSAEPCSCAAPGSPCSATWQADAVFVGRVVSIESSPIGAGRLLQFAVVETFRGVRLSQVTLVTGYGQADCGYPFRMGESYVVYAHRSPEGQLSASSCTRTRPLAEASEDLSYLRSLAAVVPGTLARVAGRVQLWQPHGQPGEPRSVPGLTVTARGQGRTFSARSNDRGEFELIGLPLGQYDITPAAPPGYASVPDTIDVRDPRGCGPTVLFVEYDGRVTGRVVDRRGVGIGGLPLQLVPPADVENPNVSSSRAQTWTKTDGTFELRRVSPGEYVLGFDSVRGYEGQLTFPSAFYPGGIEPMRASRIVVSAGERVRLRNFVVPGGLRLVTVKGIVVDEAGRPVRNASIALRDRTEGPNVIGSQFVTGGDGCFVLTLVEGGHYDIHVSRDDQVSIVPFTASAGTGVLRVVMKPRRPVEHASAAYGIARRGPEK